MFRWVKASRAAVLLFVAAALPRLAYLWIARPGFLSKYWPLSDGLLRDGSLSLDGVKTADFEPLYPIFLAVCRILTFDTPVLVQVCQVAVSALGAVLLYRLAVELTGRPTVGTAAALLFASRGVGLVLSGDALSRPDVVRAAVLCGGRDRSRGVPAVS